MLYFNISSKHKMGHINLSNIHPLSNITGVSCHKPLLFSDTPLTFHSPKQHPARRPRSHPFHQRRLSCENTDCKRDGETKAWKSVFIPQSHSHSLTATLLTTHSLAITRSNTQSYVMSVIPLPFHLNTHEHCWSFFTAVLNQSLYISLYHHHSQQFLFQEHLIPFYLTNSFQPKSICSFSCVCVLHCILLFPYCISKDTGLIPCPAVPLCGMFLVSRMSGRSRSPPERAKLLMMRESQTHTALTH